MIKKYLKKGSILFFGLALVLGGSLAYAEDDSNVNKEREEAKNRFEQERENAKDLIEKEREEAKNLREEAKEKMEKERESIKEEASKMRGDFRSNLSDDETIEAIRAKREAVIKEITQKREEFKVKVEESKKEWEAKKEEMKNKFKEDLAKIKDEKKKEALTKIDSKLDELNLKITEKLGERVSQIETVLAGVESRTNKAKDKGLDVGATEEAISLAKDKISATRESIIKQSEKIYELEVGEESTLKTTTQAVRDAFRADIKALYEEVKGTHDAVRKAAVTLAQIPKINEIEDSKDETENEIEVEDATGSTTNQ